MTEIKLSDQTITIKISINMNLKQNGQYWSFMCSKCEPMNLTQQCGIIYM